MSIKMVASKRFRLALEKGFVWKDEGQEYEVSSEKAADYHETSGRGKRAKPATPAPSGKKGE
jgi:FKBP-type peptidyl-prolyl cis-trans isomerase (trigger factor)|tara:strand:- start:11378 stop:11563 length:186 start_codon:yes stop_codon:yes gene_type:complete